MKVFSARNWVQKMSGRAPWAIIKECVDEGWVGHCDGMNVEQLKKAGHPAIPGMMIDKRDWLKLKVEPDKNIWKK